MAQVPNATILTAAQIAYYAQNAGFTGQDLQTAVAIALAESSGNPNVYNPESAASTPAGQGSYGLFQIYLNAHPEYQGVNLYDPQTNANAAYAIYAAAGGFSPWSTYNSGTYEAYMGVAAPAPAAPVVSAAPLTTDVTDLTTEASSLVPQGMDTSTLLWIGAAVVTGIVLWSFLE